MITNLERAGLSHLHHTASWSPQPPASSPPTSWTLTPLENVPHLLHFTAAASDWPTVQQWLQSITLQYLVDRHSSNGPIEDGTGSSGVKQDDTRAVDGRSGGPPATRDWTLALPRNMRCTIAELAVQALATSSQIPLFPSSSPLFASDGSMTPATPTLHQYRSVTFAATTPSSTIVCSLSSFRNSASILYAEVYGLIAAALQAPTDISHTPPSPPLYTDHLNSTRLINGSLSASFPPLPHQWSSLPACSLYHWLRDILASSPQPLLTLMYTPAHTTSNSPAASANAFVDHLASHSHTLALPTPPVPTFTMDDYTLFSSSDGYIESDPSTYITQSLITTVVDDSAFAPSHTLALPLYSHCVPPDHPYTRASSAYSALVQLYARSAQLDTAYLRFAQFSDMLPWCCFGCSALETPHHIFVQCPIFEPLRRLAFHDVFLEMSKLLAGAQITTQLSDPILRIARSLFVDDAVWPQYTSYYFLGIVPHIRDDGDPPPTHDFHRLSIRIMQMWHTTGIHLVGRIWGDYKHHPFRDVLKLDFVSKSLRHVGQLISDEHVNKISAPSQPPSSPIFGVPHHLHHLAVHPPTV
ncbi:hypothetical protein BKA93DRAFT_870422 [Sparassis latifolia]